MCIRDRKNTVGIYYKIKNGKYKSKLSLAPIINFRDFHSMNTNPVSYTHLDVYKRQL